MTSQLRILRFPDGSAVLERRAHAKAPWAGWEGDSIIARGSVEACRAAARGIGVLVRDDDAASYHDGVDEYPDPDGYDAFAETLFYGTKHGSISKPYGVDRDGPPRFVSDSALAALAREIDRAQAECWATLVRYHYGKPVPPHTASDF